MLTTAHLVEEDLQVLLSLLRCLGQLLFKATFAALAAYV
jgi:hypothetical protein